MEEQRLAHNWFSMRLVALMNDARLAVLTGTGTRKFRLRPISHRSTCVVTFSARISEVNGFEMNRWAVAKSLWATNRLHPIHKWVCKKICSPHIFCSVIGEISVKLIGKLLDWICMSRSFFVEFLVRARVLTIFMFFSRTRDFSSISHFYWARARYRERFYDSFFLLSFYLSPEASVSSIGNSLNRDSL